MYFFASSFCGNSASNGLLTEEEGLAGLQLSHLLGDLITHKFIVGKSKTFSKWVEQKNFFHGFN